MSDSVDYKGWNISPNSIGAGLWTITKDEEKFYVSWDRRSGFTCSCDEEGDGDCPHIALIKEWGKAVKEGRLKPSGDSGGNSRQAPAQHSNGEARKKERVPAKRETKKVVAMSANPSSGPGVKVPLPHSPVDIDGVMMLAKIAFKAGINQRLGPEKGVATNAMIIMFGLELGVGPVRALQEINSISGKMVISAQLLAHVARESGLSYTVTHMSEDRCSLVLYDDRGGERRKLGTYTYTMEMARKAGLANRDMWRKFPSNMLFARAMSNAIRSLAAGLLSVNVYVEGEIGDEPPEDNFSPVIRTVKVDSNGQVVGEEEEESITDSQIRAIHAMGREQADKKWDKIRPILVWIVSNGGATSLSKITKGEASILIDAMKSEGIDKMLEDVDVEEIENRILADHVGAKVEEDK